jgi:hypothetical protein
MSLQLAFKQGDAVAHQTAVGLDLLLARTTARACAAALPLQVGPQLGEAGEHVLVLRQFHLGLGVRCAGAPCEDVQDQARPIEHGLAQVLLQVALLRRADSSSSKMMQSAPFASIHAFTSASLPLPT